MSNNLVELDSSAFKTIFFFLIIPSGLVFGLSIGFPLYSTSGFPSTNKKELSM